MRKAAYWTASVALLLIAAGLAYGLHGYFSARADAASLAVRANQLIATNRGPLALGEGRVEQLLRVEDPGFFAHSGIDLSTPGSGLTTLTQSLGKRVGFSNFSPGVKKLRLMGYAAGLESKLSKPQIIALYLDTVWMGRGPQGSMTGFFKTSDTIFGRPPASLSQREFLTLVAVPLAPREFSLAAPDGRLKERVARIERLVSNKCKPRGMRDVRLEGCATQVPTPSA